MLSPVRMPGAARAALAVVLLLGPTVIAFFSGGYFDGPRLWAGIVVWLLVGLAAACAPVLLPRSGPARLALAGLAGLTLLTGLSYFWAPAAGVVQQDLERLLLYLGALIAASAFLRSPYGLRLAEPVLLAGATIVIAYGVLGRLLPGVIHQYHSVSAFGRLEQPLTYWNAMGILAAVGLVLAARIAGDPSRGAAGRAAAAAAALPLGVGLYLTFSRGSLLAAGVGVFLLLTLTRDSAQLRAVLLVTAGAVGAALAAGALGGVRTGTGPLDRRELEGVAVLGALLVGGLLAAVVQTRWISRRPAGEVRLPRRLMVVGLVVVVIAGFIVVASGSGNSGSQPRRGAQTTRLASVDSNRYAYWRVAATMFADHPVLGDGAGSFRVQWKRHRKVADLAQDTHSLYMEVASELGLAGLLALIAFLGGITWAGARVMRNDPAAGAGACAALIAMAVHAGLDWDWQMPAIALIALLLGGALLARDDDGPVAAADAA